MIPARSRHAQSRRPTVEARPPPGRGGSGRSPDGGQVLVLVSWLRNRLRENLGAVSSIHRERCLSDASGPGDHEGPTSRGETEGRPSRCRAAGATRNTRAEHLVRSRGVEVPTTARQAPRSPRPSDAAPAGASRRSIGAAYPRSGKPPMGVDLPSPAPLVPPRRPGRVGDRTPAGPLVPAHLARARTSRSAGPWICLAPRGAGGRWHLGRPRRHGDRRASSRQAGQGCARPPRCLSCGSLP